MSPGRLNKAILRRLACVSWAPLTCMLGGALAIYLCMSASELADGRMLTAIVAFRR